MNRETTSFTIADYCAGMQRNEIVVNKDYQRSDKVWPPVARSYLIETILKGFPVPKLCLYQVTDVKSRTTHKEIVDGQQRSVAIFDFLNDRFRLSRLADNEDIRGRRYSDLDPDYQQKFLEYAVNVDLFVSATPAEVVEVFRRMNSYTVPLNAEENRHASFQGKFKWFINDIADKLEAGFLATGIFKEKQIVRMADNKLLTELCDSFATGIRTTNKRILDSVYKVRDDRFPEYESWRKRLLSSFDVIVRMEAIRDTSLVRPFMIYSLVQAITHLMQPVPKFRKLFKTTGRRAINFRLALPRLTNLAEAIEAGEEAEARFTPFVEASTEKTNVRENREIRFKWFCGALMGE